MTLAVMFSFASSSSFIFTILSCLFPRHLADTAGLHSQMRNPSENPVIGKRRKFSGPVTQQTKSIGGVEQV
jgi:hypothetical protein